MESNDYTICGTGHRPNKLGGYSEQAFKRLIKLAEIWLIKYKPKKVVVGMALGWDQALAKAALKLNIPLICAVPFEGFHLNWALEHQYMFKNILSQATEIHYICEPGYEVWKLQKRNEWMVDNTDKTLSLFDGTNGGTKNCVDYAKKKNKIIINLYSSYKLMLQQISNKN